MEVKIKRGNEILDATIEMVDGVMVVSPKEVKFEPKEGDVVATKSGKYIHICKSYIGDDAINTYIGCTIEGGLIEAGRWYASRLATEKEKQKLFDKLKEEGYEWDAEKKNLNVRWILSWRN